MKRKPHAVLVVALAFLSVALASPATSAGGRVAAVSDAGAPHQSSVKFKAGYTATTSPNELTTASATFVLPEPELSGVLARHLARDRQ